MPPTIHPAELIATSRPCVAQNHALIRETRLRVAQARRACNPWFAVVGGSDASERMLRDMVRLLLAGGVLRPVDGHAWAGNGTGRPCAVCGNPVTPMEVEYEVDGDATAHTRCFLVWQEESKHVPERNS